jgi:hypothetical protein
MKKLLILFSLLTIVRFISYAQIKIGHQANADSLKLLNPNLKSIQPGQPEGTTKNIVTGVKTLYYSIDPTAFSSSWGIYDIKKLGLDGACLNQTTLGSAPYLVAPVNLPHNANITTITVVFYDVSATQDLQAILWQGGPNFGGPDSYNLGQIESNYSSGFISQAKAVNATIDNQNHSYCVSISPANNTSWPANESLKIKRITIAYTVPQSE